MRQAVFTGLFVWCMGWCLSGQGVAFVLNEGDWAYMANPMGEDWVVCPDRMPGDAVQRVKDGAAAWNYERFRFTFANDACLSDGRFSLLNSVNQVDIGPLSSEVLAESVFFFFTNNPSQVIECDLRFSSAVPWYTGTGTPGSNQFDFWSVATHEMGHCLGLNHEDRVNPLPVMRTSLPAGLTQRQLTSDDLAGRNAIYGQGSSRDGGGDEGGGGGCALVPHTPTDTRGILASLGNLGLPLLVLLAVRLWSRRR